MLNNFKIVFFLFICLLLIVFYFATLHQQPIAQKQKAVVKEVETQTQQYPLVKHITYSYNLINNSSSHIKKADFYSYTPIPQTPYQQLDSLYSKTPYTLIKDSHNNQIAHFSIENMAPFSTRKISIKAKVYMANLPNNNDENEQASYLVNTELLNLNAPKVIALANKLHSDNIQQIIENTFIWTANNISYSGYEQNEKSVVQTLETLSGDCTDYMHVFTALMRSNNIPSREMGGYIVKHNKIIRSHDYHNWVEYYSKNNWYLADPQNKKLAQDAGDYIAFKRYGNDPKSPLNHFHRYNITDQRIQISMN